MSTTYYPTIGLEIHAELKTVSKMFCSCKNDPDETHPNTNICPVCMAHPGTLPVANKDAIKKVIQVGLALDSTIADFTEFDRKNYFYPDIPKGYQISQYKYPIVSGGTLGGFAITRIHLEEDTGLSKHDRGNFSLVDFNRAGVPLMELVTEPVIHSAKEAGDFARELQLLLRTLGVSEANLEKGEMRVEPNISLSNTPESLGTKVEVKNLNSFRSVEKAIEYELARMRALYEAGRQEEIVQETRGWDENKQATFSQRSKENANDYRYFPDPDLPKMKLHSVFDLSELRVSLPELPWKKRERYTMLHHLPAEDAALLAATPTLSAFFERVVKEINPTHTRNAANYIINDLGTVIDRVSVSLVAEVVTMVAAQELTSRGAKDIFAAAISGTQILSAKEYATAHGLIQKNDDGTLRPLLEQVIASNKKMVGDYKAGKDAALQGLVGQVMKLSKGSANPVKVLQLLKDML